MGFGVSVIMPFGYTYLDDHSKPGQTSFYYACISSLLMQGWGISMAVSAILFKTWVDFPAPAPVGFSTENRNWVGAWWIGYHIYSVLLLIVILPVFKFPAVLPKQLRD